MFAVEERFNLKPFEQGSGLLEFIKEGGKVVAALTCTRFLQQFPESIEVLNRLLRSFEGFELGFKVRDFLADTGGPGVIIPESLVFPECAQFLKPPPFGSKVKDTSAFQRGRS